MVKGRKPYSKNVHEQSGAYKKNPQRIKESVPEPREGEPSKPPRIAANPIASGYWDHAISQLRDMGILTKAERSVLEMFAEAMAMRQASFAEGDITAWKKCTDACIRLAAELGLTPSARMRLVAPKQEEKDAFTEWRKGFQGISLGDN